MSSKRTALRIFNPTMGDDGACLYPPMLGQSTTTTSSDRCDQRNRSEGFDDEAVRSSCDPLPVLEWPAPLGGPFQL